MFEFEPTVDSLIQGSKSVFTEAAKRAQLWFTELNKAIASQGPNSGLHGPLPWHATREHEKPFESEMKARMMKLSQAPQEFLNENPVGHSAELSALFPMAGTILEVDQELRLLRFRLVPKYISEDDFWRRYFTAVSRIKREVMLTCMGEDNDIVHVPNFPECSMTEEERKSGHGHWIPPEDITDAEQGATPSASEDASNMVLSGHSETSNFREVGQMMAVDVKDQCQGVQRRSSCAVPCRRLKSKAGQEMIMSTSMGSSCSEALALSPPHGLANTASVFSGSRVVAPQSTIVSPRSEWSMAHRYGGGIQDYEGDSRNAAGAIHQSGNRAVDVTLEWLRRSSHPASPPAPCAQQHTNDDDVPVNADQLRRLADTLAAAKQTKDMGELVERFVSPTRGTGPKGWSKVVKKSAAAAGGSGRAAPQAEQLAATGEMEGSEKVAVAVWDLFDPMAFVEGCQKYSITEIRPPGITEHIGGVHRDGFLAAAAVAASKLNSIAEMTELWAEVLNELRWHWSSRRTIPGVPADSPPNLNLSTLQQVLMLLNCCITRSHRQSSALRISQQGDFGSSAGVVMGENGDSIPRQGALEPAMGLYYLKTGEPIYVPHTQEPPLMTSWQLREERELYAKHGSMGMECKLLLSDMCAFKAANPGCSIDDFVRWIQPSGRLFAEALTGPQTEALWRELWCRAQPIPAVRQPPVFDPVHTAEAALDFLAGLPPAHVFRQLFQVALAVQLEAAAASPLLPRNVVLQQTVEGLVNAAVEACGGTMSMAEVNRMCEVMAGFEHMLRTVVEVKKASPAGNQQAAGVRWCVPPPSASHSADSTSDAANIADGEYDGWLLL